MLTVEETQTISDEIDLMCIDLDLSRDEAIVAREIAVEMCRVGMKVGCVAELQKRFEPKRGPHIFNAAVAVLLKSSSRTSEVSGM